VFDSRVNKLFLKAPCFQLYVDEKTCKDRKIMQIIFLIFLVCILCGSAIVLYLKNTILAHIDVELYLL